MTESKVNVDEWVAMFRAIGLDDARMSAWHVEFERRHPQAHESFLRWLDLPEQRIAEIRDRAAGNA